MSEVPACPRCLVCLSTHRERYERIYDQKRSLSDVFIESKNLKDNNDKGISKMTIHKHMKWREKRIEEGTPEYLDDAIDVRVQKTIKVLDELLDNLASLQEISKKIGERITEGRADAKEISAYKGLLQEIRLTLKDIDVLRAKMPVKSDIDEKDIVKMLRVCLIDEPEEHLDHILNKLRENFGVIQ